MFSCSNHRSDQKPSVLSPCFHPEYLQKRSRPFFLSLSRPSNPSCRASRAPLTAMPPDPRHVSAPRCALVQEWVTHDGATRNGATRSTFVLQGRFSAPSRPNSRSTLIAVLSQLKRRGLYSEGHSARDWFRCVRFSRSFREYFFPHSRTTAVPDATEVTLLSPFRGHAVYELPCSTRATQLRVRKTEKMRFHTQSAQSRKFHLPSSTFSHIRCYFRKAVFRYVPHVIETVTNLL